MNNHLVTEVNNNWKECQSDLLRIRKNFTVVFEKETQDLNKFFLKSLLSNLPNEDLESIKKLLIEIREIYASSRFWNNSDEFSISEGDTNKIYQKLADIELIFNKNNLDLIKKLIIDVDEIFNDLKNDYKNKYSELMSFLKNQDIEHNIHNIYGKEKDKAICSKRIYTLLFYLVIFTIFYIGYNFFNEHLVIEWQQKTSYIISYIIISRLLSFFPLVWLALFISRRISELIKIEHTYLHKEVVSKAYINHLQFLKTQYNDDNEEIRKILTSIAINNIGFNPAFLLEKTTAEKVPMEEILLKVLDRNLIKNDSEKQNS